MRIVFGTSVNGVASFIHHSIMRKHRMFEQVAALNDKTKRFSRPEHGAARQDFDFNGNHLIGRNAKGPLMCQNGLPRR